LVIAITIPSTTNTTIAICIQIQVGDIRKERTLKAPSLVAHARRPRSIVSA
jgi:hypothetical protein